MMDSMMGGLSAAVGGIAAISLLVGGIGIMNIMLVSVTERTREIGIRKSLGARTRDILIQFLTESAILSACGGMIGILLGVGLVSVGGMALGVKAVIRPSVVVMAVGFSALVGVFFGIYPASKAAKKIPLTRFVMNRGFPSADPGQLLRQSEVRLQEEQRKYCREQSVCFRLLLIQ